MTRAAENAFRNIVIDVTVPASAWDGAVRDPAGLARRAAAAALEQGAAPGGPAWGAGGAELSIVLADDALLRELNRTYRGRDRATNVLSFPAWTPGAPAGPAGEPVALGDVVVAFETAAGEAAAQNKPLADHLAHLVVHGVLHLLGHDHARPREARRMEALERAALARLGIGDPYLLDPLSRGGRGPAAGPRAGAA